MDLFQKLATHPIQNRVCEDSGVEIGHNAHYSRLIRLVFRHKIAPTDLRNPPRAASATTPPSRDLQAGYPALDGPAWIENQQALAGLELAVPGWPRRALKPNLSDAAPPVSHVPLRARKRV